MITFRSIVTAWIALGVFAVYTKYKMAQETRARVAAASKTIDTRNPAGKGLDPDRN